MVRLPLVSVGALPHPGLRIAVPEPPLPAAPRRRRLAAAHPSSAGTATSARDRAARTCSASPRLTGAPGSRRARRAGQAARAPRPAAPPEPVAPPAAIDPPAPVDPPAPDVPAEPDVPAPPVDPPKPVTPPEPPVPTFPPPEPAGPLLPPWAPAAPAAPLLPPFPCVLSGAFGKQPPSAKANASAAKDAGTLCSSLIVTSRGGAETYWRARGDLVFDSFFSPTARRRQRQRRQRRPDRNC